MGPLASLKVVEMTGLGPAPLAGQLLADLGAEVIVIDRAAGQDFSKDVNRRGKKSVALNLKTPEGKDAAMALIQTADILIEGFRPGVMEKLGLGPEVCMKQVPTLVYARMTGWGQEGPLSHSAGHDLNYLSITGVLHAMGKRGEPPVPPLNLVADYGGGTMFLIMGILSAIIERGVSGKGQIVDAAMIDGVPSMMGLIQTLFGQGLWTNTREDNFLDGAAPYYRCYETADNNYISVGCIEPQFFKEFLEILELDLELCKKQNSKPDWSEMQRLFADTIATKTREEWADIFEGTDACVAPVLDFNEAANHHHNVARDTFMHSNGILQASPAPRFSRSACLPPNSGSNSGSDGFSVFRSVGMTDKEIDRLINEGALFVNPKNN